MQRNQPACKAASRPAHAGRDTCLTSHASPGWKAPRCSKGRCGACWDSLAKLEVLARKGPRGSNFEQAANREDCTSVEAAAAAAIAITAPEAVVVSFACVGVVRTCGQISKQDLSGRLCQAKPDKPWVWIFRGNTLASQGPSFGYWSP